MANWPEALPANNAKNDFNSAREAFLISHLDDGTCKVPGKRNFKVVGFDSFADYVCDETDDNVQINQCLQDLPDGGVVLFQRGIYQISASITPPNLDALYILIGAGMGNTILKAKDAEDLDILFNFRNLQVSDMSFDCNRDNGGSVRAIMTSSGVMYGRFHIERISVHNSKADWAVNLDMPVRKYVLNSRLENNINSLRLGASELTWIQGNHVEAEDKTLEVYGTSFVLENYFKTNEVYPTGILISGNTITEGNHADIAPVKVVATYSVIGKNRIGYFPSCWGYGLDISGEGNLVCDNQIFGHDVGINLEADAFYTHLHGNYLRLCTTAIQDPGGLGTFDNDNVIRP